MTCSNGFRWGLVSVCLFHTNQTSIKSIIPSSAGLLWLGFRQNVQLLCLSFPTTWVIRPSLEVSITPWCLGAPRRLQRKAQQEPGIINKASRTPPLMLQQTPAHSTPRARCAALAQKAKKQEEAARFFIFISFLIKLNKTWRHVLCCCSCPFAQWANHKYFRGRVQKICKTGPSLLQH